MGPFEVFDPQAVDDGSGRGVPVIYVLSEGRLKLNAAAVRLLGSTAWVHLLWDEDTKRIGIQPAAESAEAVFKVTPGDSQATITSLAFVRAHSLPHKVRMRIAWSGDMWVASTINPDHPLGKEPETNDVVN